MVELCAAVIRNSRFKIIIINNKDNSNDTLYFPSNFFLLYFFFLYIAFAVNLHHSSMQPHHSETRAVGLCESVLNLDAAVVCNLNSKEK